MTLVRPFAAGDKAACLDNFYSNVPEYFDMSEEDLLSGFLDAPDGQYFVIEQAGNVIGNGGFAKEDDGQARFTWGMVHRDFHGHGLGRLLTEHRLQEIARRREFSEAELFTTPKVAPFFEKFGFEAKQIDKDGYAPGMDRVQMIKNLA